MRRLLVCLFVLFVNTIGQVILAQEYVRTLVDQEHEIWAVSTSASGDRWAISRETVSGCVIDVYIAGVPTPVTIPSEVRVSQIGFTADGLVTLSSFPRHLIYSWQWDASRQVYQQKASMMTGAYGLTVAPMGDEVAIALSKTIDRWNGTNSSSSVYLRPPGTGWFKATPPTYSPDGKYVAAGFDKSLMVFDRKGGLPLWQQEQVGQLLSVAYSADGRYLAGSIYQRGTSIVSVWDFENPKKRPLTYKVKGKQIEHLVWHGPWLVSAGAWHDENTGETRKDSVPHIVLWNVFEDKKLQLIPPDKKKVPSFRPHASYISGIAVGQMDGVLLTASGDGLVHVWQLPKLVLSDR